MIDFISSNPSQFLGILLILLNIPLGWLVGIGLFVKIAVKKQKISYIFVGLGIYLISWAMMLLGLYLCGETLYKKLYLLYGLLLKAAALICIIAVFFIIKSKLKAILKLIHSWKLKNKESQ
ncbi:MAG: hypothetical protein LBB93_02660 [Elusimicrobiota bacterium]|nr:hypothetical protein [Elusimicrobiota bacterium]